MSANRTNVALRRRTILAMAIASVGLSGASVAHADHGRAPVDLQVVDRATGQQLPVWRHDGRLFVAGQPGARYSLRVTNHIDGRVLVVMSVDGVNILTGETAGYDQRGYVLDPYASYDISGWRKSNTEVADFAFASLPQSYAARTGRPGDVGVIGIAVFEERPAPQAFAPPAAAPREPNAVERRHAARSRDFPMAVPAPAPSSIAPVEQPAPPPPAADGSVTVTARKAEDRLGTAHGEREWSVSYTVSFDRATPYPIYLSQIEYDTFDNLVTQGVIPAYRPAGPRPRAFPSNANGAGFVPDPPGDP
jgi:hypothetical protein